MALPKVLVPAQQPEVRIDRTTNSLFPTFDSYEEVEAFACSRVPVHSHNEMHGILQVARNTTLKEVGNDFNS